MKFLKTLGVLALTCSMVAAFGTAQAAPKPLQVGLVLSMSGPFSTYGNQIKHGIDLYIAEHGNVVAGRKIQQIDADDTGIAPQVAKRKTTQLILNKHVDMLDVFDFTPNEIYVATLHTQ